MRRGWSLAVLITIAHFYDHGEAEIVRAKLEQAGLCVFLADAHYINVVPIHMTALGGIRLQVISTEADEARILLDDHHISTARAIDQCPACGSGDVFRPQSVWLNLILLYFFKVIGAPKSGRKHCRSCRHTWK